MRIDWQMYEDGEFGPEAKRLAEKALSEDPSARAELEGLRAFKRSVREAAMAEPVPVRSMEEKLGEIVGRRQSSRWQVRVAAAVIAVVVIGLGYAAVSAVMWSNPAIEQRAEFDSLVTAIDWSSDRSKLAVPPFAEEGVGTFTSVHSAQGWACFDFLVKGKSTHVTVSRRKAFRTYGPTTLAASDKAFIINDAGLARFSAKGLVFVVDSGDADTNVMVSRAILSQLVD
jgi:hypothetical protein